MQELENLPGKIVPRKGLRIGDISAECKIVVNQALHGAIDINCMEAKAGSEIDLNPWGLLIII